MQNAKLNGMIIASIVINGLASLLFLIGQTDEYAGLEGVILGFFGLMMAFWACSLVGAVLIKAGNPKTGAVLVMIGCALFVPIGLIGVFGAKKVREELKSREFMGARPEAGQYE